MPKKFVALVAVGLIVVGAGFGFAVAKSFDQINSQDAKSQAQEPAGHEHAPDLSDDAEQLDLTSQKEVGINIINFAYVKQNIKIKKGTTVKWTNLDTMEHNAMKEHEGEEHAHNAPSKDEVRPDVFAGPLLKTGESYSFTFNNVGTIHYHCAPHPFMTGTITVVE